MSVTAIQGTGRGLLLTYSWSIVTSSPQKARECEKVRSTFRLLRHQCAHNHATSKATASTSPNPKSGLLLNPAPTTNIATAPQIHAREIWLMVIISGASLPLMMDEGRRTKDEGRPAAFDEGWSLVAVVVLI